MGEVNATPKLPPAHMLAEKNEKPSMMTSMERKPRLFAVCTCENTNSCANVFSYFEFEMISLIKDELNKLIKVGYLFFSQ